MLLGDWILYVFKANFMVCLLRRVPALSSRMMESLSPANEAPWNTNSCNYRVSPYVSVLASMKRMDTKAAEHYKL
jgi:hypothetical protein